MLGKYSTTKLHCSSSLFICKSNSPVLWNPKSTVWLGGDMDIQASYSCKVGGGLGAQSLFLTDASGLCSPVRSRSRTVTGADRGSEGLSINFSP